MNVISLLENTACRADLRAEHGLSLYIETEDRRILFDAGQTEAFAENAQALGVDLSQVDLCILSHGHYDHGGGLLRFLALNDHAPVYVSRHAFGRYYNGTEKYIGLAPELRHTSRLVFVDSALDLGHGLTIFGCGEHETVDSAGLTVLEDGEFRPDCFCHEQYLLIREGEKRILFSGCSHRGILNIIRRFQPDVFFGGFHFMKRDPETLSAEAEALLSHPTTYYTGHCTGEAQYAWLKAQMSHRLHPLSCGTVVTL